jgi:hypothetical protein
VGWTQDVPENTHDSFWVDRRRSRGSVGPPVASPMAVHDDCLAAVGGTGERFDDPTTCLLTLRQFGERLAQRAAVSVSSGSRGGSVKIAEE